MMAFLYWAALIVLVPDACVSIWLAYSAWAKWRAAHTVIYHTDTTNYKQCRGELESVHLKALVHAWVSTIFAAGYVSALVYVILSGM